MLPFKTNARHFGELLGIAWANRKDFPYAWKLLHHPVCDGCLLDLSGSSSKTFTGIHVCMPRLRRLNLNTMSALDIALLAEPTSLRKMTPRKLAALGRLPQPMIRRSGERGFSPTSWDSALAAIRDSIHDTPPAAMAFFATTHGLTNEVYYIFQKLARVLGSNNLNLCSCCCHGDCVSGLKEAFGIGASTCSLADLVGTDLLVLCGVTPGTVDPLTRRYITLAQKAGTQVIIVDPSEGADNKGGALRLFTPDGVLGTSPPVEFFSVRAGGNVAFFNGVLKELINSKRLAEEYINTHTVAFGAVKAAIERQSWEYLQRCSGIRRGRIQRVADLYGRAHTAVFVYGVAFTDGEFGAQNVKAVVNLALARAMLGRAKCGIMALCAGRSTHAGRECGVAPDRFPGDIPIDIETARRFSNLWHHPVPSSLGLRAPEILAAAQQNKVDFLYSIGSNPCDAGSDWNSLARALGNVRMRVHQDIALTPSMLVDAKETVLLLPSQTFYEQTGGGTLANVERRLRFRKKCVGRQVGDSLAEWEIPVRIGRQSMSNGEQLFPFDNTESIRAEMSRVIPMYYGIERLQQEGDQFQWGGPFLFKDGFNAMPYHRAVFTVLEPRNSTGAETNDVVN
jgi:molybdopterin-dependent oxidoreductase alpha subunit